MAFVAIAVSVTIRVMRNQPPDWTPYTSTSLRTALEQNHCVLISLSANWGNSGVMHERTAIKSVEAYRTIRNIGVTAFRADATNRDPAVMQLMKANGLISIPAFLLYNPSCPEEPIILKDLVSEEQLMEATL